MSSNSDSERIVANRYILRRELGRGGMGVVWEAFDPSLDRTVAIKQVLLPDHFTDEERADAHARVRREARSAARISHPSVITIHDVFDFEGDPWVVMELVEGGSLQDMLEQRGALDVETTATIAEALLKAVQAADAAGVLHRDIKPGNIMMSADGRVILTDFGIATMEGGPSITRTGALIGSPEYMPPERLEGGPAEHRGDLWSIGVTLFATVEGLSPFRRDSITAAIAAVLGSPLPPMRRAGRLTPVIAGLLERDPDRRLTVDGALALLDERGGADAAGAHGNGHAPGRAFGREPAASGGYPGSLGAASNNGPLSGPHPGMGGPSGPHTPPRPFPPHGPTTPGTPFGPSRPQLYDPYGAPQQKQGMSTGAKVGIGVGAGCLVLVVIAVVIIVVIAMSSSGGDDSGTTTTSPTTTETTEPGGGEEGGGDAPVEAPAEDGVTLTATNAGTVSGTLDPNETYTALDVTFVNNSSEPLSINPLYFTFILDDGTEVVDWELFADITQLEAADLAPGDQVSGQVAVAGEVTVVEVSYDPSFGMEEPIVVPVQ